MKIIPVYNFKLLLPGYEAITLYPFVCIRSSKALAKYQTIKHEMIHVQQIRRYGWFSFYITYLMYFVANMIRYRDWGTAYYDIPWEKEAFDNELTPLTQEEAVEFGVD